MVKRIHESFEDADHAAMHARKLELSENIGRKITWEEYFLHVSGVREIKSPADNLDMINDFIDE